MTHATTARWLIIPAIVAAASFQGSRAALEAADAGPATVALAASLALGATLGGTQAALLRLAGERWLSWCCATVIGAWLADETGLYFLDLAAHAARVVPFPAWLTILSYGAWGAVLGAVQALGGIAPRRLGIAWPAATALGASLGSALGFGLGRSMQAAGGAPPMRATILAGAVLGLGAATIPLLGSVARDEGAPEVDRRGI